MKKVLVTGAAGSIGMQVIKYLLAEGKYEITALDLKNKKVYKRLHRYRKRINIVYGDILDRNLVENTVKDQDAIIHLASCLPPLASFHKDIAHIIEYNGIENIIRTICYYNPSCYLIYASSTSIYKDKPSSVKDKINLDSKDYFNNAKYNAEQLVSKKMKNYTILRLPLILSDLTKDAFIYYVNKKKKVEVISKEDAAYAFCKCLDKEKEVNNKILNIGGGQSCQTDFSNIINNIIKYHGLSLKYLCSYFVSKDFDSPILKDSDESNAILKYRNDSLQSYYMRQKRRSKNRKFSKGVGKIYLAFTKKGDSK